MMTYTLRLIFRSWWRNKTFFVISVLSMAIGLACTNILMAFVIYESNIEADNPGKENILYMSQTYPMDTMQTISYIAGNIPQQLKENYPEIEDYLRLRKIDVRSFSVRGKRMNNINIISSDSSYAKFFPCPTLHGDINKVFSSGGKIAISETFAKRVFGDAYPVGEIIRIMPVNYIFPDNTEENDYEVVAVLKDRDQAFISFDAITLNHPSFHGGPTLLLTNNRVNPATFSQKLKDDKIPTLQNQIGRYYFSSLQDSYFNNYTNESFDFIKRQQPVILYSGWLAAILIFIIACINYTNLSFSRILEQVKLIKVQRLIGASSLQVSIRLFLDTFLTILIAFLISLLIIHDLVPLFNSIVSGRLHTGFFFSNQVFPFLLLLLVTFSFLASTFMSYRLQKTPAESTNSGLFKRQQTIRVLSITQYTISFALVITTIIVNKQLNYIKNGGESYRNVFEISSYEMNPEQIQLVANKINNIPGIESITTSKTSVLYSMIRQIAIKGENGTENYTGILEFYMSGNFMQTLSLNLLKGFSPEEAEQLYARPVYVNQEFLDILVPRHENPIGKPITTFDNAFREQQLTPGADGISIIAGVVESLHTSSFENKIQAQAFHIDNEEPLFIQFRLSNASQYTMQQIEAIWDEVVPFENFNCADVFQQYMERNKNVTGLADLLLIYAAISLFLTAFGLFGIAYYATIQRTKEIGIRRVNGATGFQILVLLNRRFFNWAGIAFFIATPVTWLFLQKWLQYFVYHIEITFDIFILAGFIIIGVTLLAVSRHTYKASASNPVESLKSE